MVYAKNYETVSTCRENCGCGFFFPGMVYNHCNIAALPDAAAVIGFHNHSQKAYRVCRYSCFAYTRCMLVGRSVHLHRCCSGMSVH